MTLYDLDQVDFKYLLKEAIDDGFVVDKRELNSYISTLKKIFNLFKKNKNPIYKESYEQILEISKNIFLF